MKYEATFLVQIVIILWHIDLLLGKDLKTNNKTTAIAMQQCSKHASTTTELRLETGAMP
jgi:hypothetical protein